MAPEVMAPEVMAPEVMEKIPTTIAATMTFLDFMPRD
jgi:hypothetical protein